MTDITPNEELDNDLNLDLTDQEIENVETSSGPGPIRKILNNIFKTFMWIIFFVLLIWYYTVNPALYQKVGSGIWNGVGNLYTYTKNVITGNDAELVEDIQDEAIQEGEVQEVEADDIEIEMEADTEEQTVEDEQENIVLGETLPTAVITSGTVVEEAEEENIKNEKDEVLVSDTSEDTLSGSLVENNDSDIYTGAEIQFQKGLEFSVGGYDVEVLDIPAGETVELKQEGYHIKITNK